MKNVSEIICKNLTIDFPLFDSAARSVKASLGRRRAPLKTFTAINNISVTIEKGDRVGLLGRNGAGKSTFLRVLAGVYPQTTGDLSISGKVTSLFDVSVGTDPDASGYENIPLLMVSRNIPLKLYKDVVKDVEEFTELGEALFRPVRTYSQGMRLRLAFAVATYQSNDILLMDEIIGVGDQNFSTKADIRIKSLMDQTPTLVLASHANSILKTHTKRGIVFDQGKIVFDGSIEEAINYNTPPC